ncbi:hypothetical protein PIB30_083955 [Stylosanthes scabra]|uniref:Uncharacterized protein n=1 Tax=Stylosanthes scabra TaxID=79078 RepID=A0ABU6WV51_9FABA|nr:hypothetical protein [Stylosanthes scabra]
MEKKTNIVRSLNDCPKDFEWGAKSRYSRYEDVPSGQALRRSRELWMRTVLSYFEKWRIRNLVKTFVSLERELYGWVDEEIFTQPSVVEADAFPELRREMRLAVGRAAEGDYALEATGPSDRLPFHA